METFEIGFIGGNWECDTPDLLFGYEKDCPNVIKKLTEVATTILNEMGYKEKLQTLEVSFPYDYDNGYEYLDFDWKIGSEDYTFSLISLHPMETETIVYKDNKYRTMFFYKVRMSDWALNNPDRDFEHEFAKKLVEKLPLNK